MVLLKARTSFSERYAGSPIRPLVQLVLTISNPFAGAAESAFIDLINHYKERRARVFFDRLGEGRIKLTPEIIQDNDSVHATIAVMNAVMRSRTDEKVMRFADLYRSYLNGNIRPEAFEDYLKILDELTDREFQVLAIKVGFEREFGAHDHPEIVALSQRADRGRLSSKQCTSVYWSRYEKQVRETTGLTHEEFQPTFTRLQRTGCYVEFGRPNDGPEVVQGNVTPVFYRIMEALEAAPL